MIVQSEKSFSSQSLERVPQQVKLRGIASSLDSGWTSLLVQNIENTAARVEAFEAAPTPDFTLVLFAKGMLEIESFSGGSWKKAIQQPGGGGMTAGGKTDRLRSRSLTSEPVETISIYIPAYYFAAAAEEYRRAGTSSNLDQPDSLAFYDPIIAQTAFALLEAVNAGAPNLYAESGAQFLATHLLAKNSRWRASVSAKRNPGALTDSRLKRVLEYMRYQSAENLSLEELAKEAGISRFHFITLFKQAVGATPHQYLVRLRLEHAAELLAKTDLKIQVIATICGFAAPSHFSKLFLRYFGRTASEHRRAALIPRKKSV